MKVHIVLWNDQHIVPRMTQWLVEAHGWTVGETPDPTADINYYMPYLKYSPDEAVGTPTAAWFTHYERGTLWKEVAWEKARQDIDAALVTAPMYLDYVGGKGALITPGVDLDLFVPGPPTDNDKPVVGIVGVGQPRKGPQLLVDLFYSDLPIHMTLIGSNWPFPHHAMVEAWEMPKFYHAIDVFLCSSLIEGIPAPVLEALACDKKVCIPEGVGICSELPEMPGLRHYVRGNSMDMLKVLQQVIADEPEPGSLRAVVEERYTIQHWCDSHKAAMEVLIANAAIQV